LQASLAWIPGQTPTWNAQLVNLELSTGGQTQKIANLKFPPQVALDFSNPGAVATALGITVPNIESLLRLLLARVHFDLWWNAGICAFRPLRIARAAQRPARRLATTCRSRIAGLALYRSFYGAR